jgi:D-alanyl-D-alanine dipeptidase
MAKFWGILGLILILTGLAQARIFPANKNSVALENHYADVAGIEQLENAAQVQAAIADGRLVYIPITSSPKLPFWRRYVRPAAAEFMLELDGRFNQTTGHYLTVDSAVRPQDVQRQLARRNRSAAPATGTRASSHERGTTFDISKIMKRGEYRWLLTQLAYYQALGRIHVIEEKACIHIMVREDTGI